ncbi:MAG: hypothetical protein J6S14_02270 [Clostridia bacterium]|nr:hypothetical protein [Clostridia bacterium]
MSDPGTWIKLDRNILNWEWYKNANTKAVFIHLLLKANTKTGQYRGMTVKRGQIAASCAALATETGLTVRNVRTALGHLSDTGEINVRACSGFSLVTIVNYDRYQETAKPSRQPREKVARKKKETKAEPPPPVEEKYLPQEWELEIPPEMWGKFSTEEKWWAYAGGGEQ